MRELLTGTDVAETFITAIGILLLLYVSAHLAMIVLLFLVLLEMRVLRSSGWVVARVPDPELQDSIE